VSLTGPFQATTTTDGNGAFTFEDLPPGAYSVTAEVGWTVQGTRTVEAALAGAGVVLHDLVFDPAGEVEGEVRGWDGEPVAGASVAVLGASATASSDELGRFRLRAVPPGTHTVVASAVGHGVALLAGVEVQYATVVAAPLLTLGMLAPGVVRGEVRLLGAPNAEGTQVSVVGTGVTTVAGADGKFELVGVPQGQHLLEISNGIYREFVPNFFSTDGLGGYLLDGAMYPLPRIDVAPAVRVAGGYYCEWTEVISPDTTRLVIRATTIENLPTNFDQSLCPSTYLASASGGVPLLLGSQTHQVWFSSDSRYVFHLEGSPSTGMDLIRANAVDGSGATLILSGMRSSVYPVEDVFVVKASAEYGGRTYDAFLYAPGTGLTSLGRAAANDFAWFGQYAVMVTQVSPATGRGQLTRIDRKTGAMLTLATNVAPTAIRSSSQFNAGEAAVVGPDTLAFFENYDGQVGMLRVATISAGTASNVYQNVHRIEAVLPAEAKLAFLIGWAASTDSGYLYEYELATKTFRYVGGSVQSGHLFVSSSPARYFWRSYYSATTGTGSMYTLNRTNWATTFLGSGAGGAGGPWWIHPYFKVSPSGTRVAVLTNWAAGAGTLRITELATGVATVGPAGVRDYPTYSAGESVAVFKVGPTSSPYSLYTMPVPGGTATLAASGVKGHVMGASPSWLLYSTTCDAYAMGSSICDLWAKQIGAGGSPTLLAAAAKQFRFFADGTGLLFRHDVDPATDRGPISAVSFANVGTVKRLVLAAPAWLSGTPDGRRLLFVNDPYGNGGTLTAYEPSTAVSISLGVNSPKTDRVEALANDRLLLAAGCTTYSGCSIVLVNPITPSATVLATNAAPDWQRDYTTGAVYMLENYSSTTEMGRLKVMAPDYSLAAISESARLPRLWLNGGRIAFLTDWDPAQSTGTLTVSGGLAGPATKLLPHVLEEGLAYLPDGRLLAQTKGNPPPLRFQDGRYLVSQP